MSKVSLEKRTQQVGVILEKRAVKQIPPIRVGLALDVSGSSEWMYNNGIMQETVDRLLAVAMKFDDNGELDMWAFDNQATALETATANSYGDYVRKAIMENRNVHKWHGTEYAPPIQKMINHYFGGVGAAAKGMFGGLFGSKAAAPVSGEPAMCMLITDGQNFDRNEAAKLLRDAVKYNIYWQMVGVGNPSEFAFIRQMADELPNVGYVNLSSLDLSDEQLYNQLIGEEFCEWIKKLKP